METLIKHQNCPSSTPSVVPAPAFADEHLARVHAQLPVTGSDFDELVQLLSERLPWHSFPAVQTDTIVAHFERRRDLIVSNG